MICGQARGIICKCQSAAGSGAGSPDCCRGRGDRDFWVCRSRCSLRSAVSGQASAASWAALGGAVALMNLIIGGHDTVVYTTTITVLCTASTLGVLIWRPGSNGPGWC